MGKWLGSPREIAGWMLSEGLWDAQYLVQAQKSGQQYFLFSPKKAFLKAFCRNLLAFMLEKNETIATAGSALIMVAAIVGIVVLVTKRKTIAYHLRPAPVEPEHTLLAGLKSPGLWLFVLSCLALAVYFMITI